MNTPQIFSNEKFGRVRIVMVDNKPMFLANDVAKALGYSYPKNAIQDHCKGVDILSTPTDGGIQKMKYIPESDVYRLVMRSKLPQAEQFQDWVCDEVLPTIRKTGGYVAAHDNDTPEMIMARAVLVANQTIAKQKQQLEQAHKQVPLSRPKPNLWTRCSTPTRRSMSGSRRRFSACLSAATRFFKSCANAASSSAIATSRNKSILTEAISS